jgi:regulator of protease activity HflC (stomatin/prohibitin superfamily)
MKEKELHVASGGLMLALWFLVVAGGIALIVTTATGSDHPGPPAGMEVVRVLGGVAAIIVAVVGLCGLFVVNPNEGRVMQLFGRYVGTVRQEGLRWANPFYSKRHISLRVRNFETAKIKVNDIDGNPIEIGAVVNWRVIDTAEACFVVEDYAAYVHVQAEAAIRNLATHYPYDGHDDTQLSLRGHTDAVAEKLQEEIQDRLSSAGVEVVEARIAHLAYAPEIAQAMLQRQQAGAIIAARQRIVEGAVGMVQLALDKLAKDGIVELDADRKAAMVSNLLVVLCGERGTQPVVNTGTIYQ